MKCPKIFPDEPARLLALASYGFEREGILESLEPVVQIASHMFNMPVAAVNMIGDDHVFFAASIGVDPAAFDMRRDVSFCAHTITQSEVMVVPDTRQDLRFFDNPLVAGPANVQFYAGVPLRSPEGFALGALCILDTVPHPEFSAADEQRLAELAKMACDRLELRRVEYASERTRPPFETYAGSLSTAVIWFDASMRIIEWNLAATARLGYEPEHKNKLQFDQLIAQPKRAQFCQLITQAAERGSLEEITFPTEIHLCQQDGTPFLVGLMILGWREQGRMTFEAIIKNPGLSQSEDEIQHINNLDKLTGLANRGLFYRTVEANLINGEANMCVLIIDLDGFKDINDTLGHEIGDAILRAVATRLKNCAHSSDCVSRIGGDEFAILSSQHPSEIEALNFANQITQTLSAPFFLHGQEIRISASCGFALAPKQTQEALELVSNADLALFKAKTTGPGHSYLFDPGLRHEATSRRLHGLELHRAVDRGEFILFFQPQINLSSGAITGAEALLRWHHPERGLLTAATFINALENGPLAPTVGSWVLEEACALAAQWRRNFSPQFRIGVNLCGAQFYRGSLAHEITCSLARHGLPPQALELEVTENTVLANENIILDDLHRLHSLGVGIAFDDFGTGYASLSLLKSFPLTRIKIDKTFVRGISSSRRDGAVVRAILDMAHNFELETIAEGIETDSEYQFLQRVQCNEGQGFLFGKPMPAQQFEELLSSDQCYKDKALA